MAPHKGVEMNGYQNPATRIPGRVYAAFDPDEVKELDDWGFSQRIRSRSEVVRRLVRLGLDAAKKGSQGGA